MLKSFPCLAVFMSSFTIMAIAIDRHRMICRPTYRQVLTGFHFCKALFELASLGEVHLKIDKYWAEDWLVGGNHHKQLI